MELNLSCVEPQFIEHAKKDLVEGNILQIMAYMSNTRSMCFVADNYPMLKQAGVYEKALLHAWIGTRTNFSNWSFPVLEFLFEYADGKTLLECGEPLPGNGPFTVYRGIAGRGPARRIRGISWTTSLERAIWFAKRFNFQKPTVFSATVEKSMVYLYTNERQEAEFLCKIPSDLKLKKVWQEKSMG
jgi:hypothetical protein